MDRVAGVRVLLVEDDVHDAALLRAMFSKETQGSFRFTRAECMLEAEGWLQKGGFDCILLDLGLPDVCGLDTLRRARAAAPEVAIIVLSGLDDEYLSTAAITEGAQDYVIKGQVEGRALPRALRHTIEYQRMQMETAGARQAQLQQRDDFLSHVSHELRGPLTSIYSFTTILADGLAGETNALQDGYLQSIFRNAQQLQAMIEEMLEQTQVTAVKLGEAPVLSSLNKSRIEGDAAEGWDGDMGGLALPFAPPPVRDLSEARIQKRWVSKIGGVF